MTRNLIIGFITTVAILIFGFGAYLSSGLSGSGEIIEGEDYQVVEGARPRRANDPIDVVEFFSYRCIHCKNFEPELADWIDELADDVTFRRRPTSFSPVDALLGQAYLAMEELDVLEDNHNRMFRAIHDAGRQFLSADMVADYVDGRGTTKDDFLRAFNSPKIKRSMRTVESDQRRLRIAATPSLVVAGKYVVGMRGGHKRALAVVDHLIEQERSRGAAES